MLNYKTHRRFIFFSLLSATLISGCGAADAPVAIADNSEPVTPIFTYDNSTNPQRGALSERDLSSEIDRHTMATPRSDLSAVEVSFAESSAVTDAVTVAQGIKDNGPQLQPDPGKDPEVVVIDGETAVPVIDADRDGYGQDEDCDDSNPMIHPGAVDFPEDGVDSDCIGGDLFPSDKYGIFVAPHGDDANGGTMDSPMASLEAAMTKAASLDKVVFLSAGQYTSAITVPVSIFGGYEATHWSRDMTISRTLVEGVKSAALRIKSVTSKPIGVSGLSIDGRVGCTGVIVEKDTHAVLKYNRITGGHSGCGSSHGVAVLGENSRASVTYSVVSGGNGQTSSAVYVGWNNASADITRSTVIASGDTACYALLVQGADDDLSGSVSAFGSSFVSDGDGCVAGGIRIENGASAAFYRSIVSQISTNVTSAHLQADTTVFHHANVISNSGTTVFTGSVAYNSSLHFAGTTHGFIANTIVSGAPVRISPTSALTMYHNDIWAPESSCLVEGNVCVNEPAQINACDWPGCDGAFGNISADPEFINPTFADFHIRGSSPCVDAGVNLAAIDQPVTADMDGEERGHGKAFDIGIDEYID